MYLSLNSFTRYSTTLHHDIALALSIEHDAGLASTDTDRAKE